MNRGKGWARTLSRWTCTRKDSTSCCCTLRGWGEDPHTHQAKARATFCYIWRLPRLAHPFGGPIGVPSNDKSNDPFCGPFVGPFDGLFGGPFCWPAIFARIHIHSLVLKYFLHSLHVSTFIVLFWNYSCTLHTLPQTGLEILPALFVRFHIHRLVLKFFLHSSHTSTLFLVRSWNSSKTLNKLPHSKSGFENLYALFARFYIHNPVLKFFLHSKQASTFKVFSL